MSVKILCVDDEPNILSGYQRSLRKQFAIETALGGSEALEKMEASGPYAVIVTDMRMPGMDGIQFLKAAQGRDPDSVRIMLTGNADQQTAVVAVNEGHIFRFLNKPCTPEDLARTLTAGLKQYQLITAEKELLEKTLGGTIKVLMEILAMVDPDLFGRAQMLRRNMHTLADALRRNGQLAREDLWPLELASLLAHVGTVTVPDFIVAKVKQRQPLSEGETKLWRQVPEAGYTLLRHIPRLEPVAVIVRYQHKHFDGGGLPKGPTHGELIPLGARMLKVLLDLADIEARHITRTGALALMQRQANRYDPQILAAARQCMVQADPIPQQIPTISIPFESLAPGHVIAGDIQTVEGKILLSAGRLVTQVLMERLRNHAAITGIKEPICVRAALSVSLAGTGSY